MKAKSLAEKLPEQRAPSQQNNHGHQNCDDHQWTKNSLANWSLSCKGSENHPSKDTTEMHQNWAYILEMNRQIWTHFHHPYFRDPQQHAQLSYHQTLLQHQDRMNIDDRIRAANDHD
jgi:hypothetical protein